MSFLKKERKSKKIYCLLNNQGNDFFKHIHVPPISEKQMVMNWRCLASLPHPPWRTIKGPSLPLL